MSSARDAAAREKALKRQFRTYDLNRDGKLSFDEMISLLRAGDPTFSEKQLRAIFAQVDKDGDQMVNFDEFVDYVTSKTKPAEGLVLEEEVPWSTAVKIPRAYQRRGARLPQTEQRGITMLQIAMFSDLLQSVLKKVEIFNDRTQTQVTWENVNMYDIDPHFVRPLTLRFRCSFTELVASGPQLPKWFVSHWWGTEFYQTKALLEFHLVERQLPSATAYWICTFANNQHDLSELASSLKETPFVKAIMSKECAGTLAICDANVTTLRRVWCCLENFVSTVWANDAKSCHFYDIAAWLPEGEGMYGGQPVPAKPTLRMDLGLGMMKEKVLDEESGGMFPLMVAREGAKTDIFQAQASQKDDWKKILHLIAGTPESDWSQEPPPESANYIQVNRRARYLFAAGAIYDAVVRDDIDDVDDLKKIIAEFPDMVDVGIGNDNATALHGAAFKQKIPSLQALLTAKANPNVQKKGGTTPIFISAQHAHDDALKMLLQARGDPNIGLGNGFLPIHIASQNQHKNTLRILLQAAAEPNLPSRSGCAPLHIVAHAGDVDAIKVLLQGRANVNLSTGKGRTPLMLADPKNEDVVKVLMDAKANPVENQPSKAKRTVQPAAFGVHFGDHAMSTLTPPGATLEDMFDVDAW
eukprot:TRINITY_DN88778_c0_g1_i1.p1 TRINITY_DN88778_c0_g1~~TRINITY_DN88778_c0_g1_i1.p1  ORF type:complete len:652 (-),score=118.11 TRINITY_DN88778_c0_g1_i1:385-2301(-)